MFASELSAKNKAARRKKWLIAASIFSLLMLAANSGLVRPSSHPLPPPASKQAACSLLLGLLARLPACLPCMLCGSCLVGLACSGAAPLTHLYPPTRPQTAAVVLLSKDTSVNNNVMVGGRGGARAGGGAQRSCGWEEGAGRVHPAPADAPARAL